MFKERQSWSVKNEAIHEDLVALMGLSAEEGSLLAQLKTEAHNRARAMTEDFYNRLFAHDPTKEYFEGQDMERLHGMISNWFVDLFGGQYDNEYVKHRIGIGQIHVRIGLPVRYPLAMLDIVVKHGEEIAATSAQPEAAKAAFRKVAALDVAIFNQAYEDNQLKHLVELVGSERLARRLLVGLG